MSGAVKLRFMLTPFIISVTLVACRSQITAAQQSIFSSLFSQTEVIPAGPLAHFISPDTVRKAILTAVTATGVQPPFDAYIAKTAADRVIHILNLEETRVSRPGLIRSLFDTMAHTTRVTSAKVVARATQTAVRSITSMLVGQTVGDAVARLIAGHVLVALNGGAPQLTLDKQSENENVNLLNKGDENAI